MTEVVAGARKVLCRYSNQVERDAAYETVLNAARGAAWLGTAGGLCGRRGWLNAGACSRAGLASACLGKDEEDRFDGGARREAGPGYELLDRGAGDV